LPAIQRKFVWSIDQIEVLFDSLIRGYPINSLMSWEVKDEKTKKDYRFYQFNIITKIIYTQVVSSIKVNYLIFKH